MVVKKRVRKALAFFLAALILGTLTVPGAMVQAEESVIARQNLLSNADFESGTADGFFVSGAQNGTEKIVASKEQVHAGSYAAKFSGRTTASTIAQSYAGVEFGKEYVYSAYVYSEIPMWINLQATMWAHYDGGSLWNTARGEGILLEAGKWTRVEASYRLYVDGGKLYMVCNSGEPVLAQDFASQAEVKPSSYRNLHHVDFEINALDTLDTLYVDDVELYDAACPCGIKNLALNQGAESGTTDGWQVYSSDDQSSVVISSDGEPVFAGKYSVKFNRTGTGSQVFQSVSGIELGKEYTYTVWAYSSAATWANLIATPWGVNDNGNPMWNDIQSEGFLLEADTWTKLYGTFKVYTDAENRLWISYGNGVAQAINHGVLEDSQIFASLAQVDFKFTASDYATIIYLDEFMVYDTAKPNPDSVSGEPGTETPGGSTTETPGGNPGDKPSQSEEDDKKSDYNVNLFQNPGFENGNFDGYGTQGDNIKVTVENGNAHSGDYVLKVTGRKSADEMPFQSLAGETIRMGEWYRFSVWVKPSKTVWVSLIATPWAAGEETGAPMWNDSYGDQKVAEADKWTKLDCAYRFTVEAGKLYVDNGKEKLLVKNHADAGDVTFASLTQVDFKVNAEPGADVLYVDDFSVICGKSPKTGDDASVIVILAVSGLLIGFIGAVMALRYHCVDMRI